MDSFSMGGAWSFGFRFFMSRPWAHALILIGIGVLVPCLAQYGPMAAGLQAPEAGLTGQAITAAAQVPQPTVYAGAIVLIAYVLQLASWFMSWRLGFDATRPVGGAMLFGLLAALIAAGLFALIGAPAFWALAAARSAGIPFIGMLVALIPLAMVFALFYTLPAAVMATIASILLVVTMVFGTVTGNVGMAATLMGGGSGAVVVLFLVMSVVLMWLATRLSCTTSVMADWKTYNFVAAMRESWRLTLEDQWAIMRYLALIAFGLSLLVIGLIVVAGIGSAAYFQGNPGAGGPIVALVAGVVIGIPFAFLIVLLPAGIYRELTRSSLAAEVFV